jgi:hypothetical protein
MMAIDRRARACDGSICDRRDRHGREDEQTNQKTTIPPELAQRALQFNDVQR